MRITKIRRILILLSMHGVGYTYAANITTPTQPQHGSGQSESKSVENLPRPNFNPTKNNPSNASSNSNGNNPNQLSPDKVILNFENSDIQTTIKAISQLSGKNFVIDPRVKGTVTIVSDKPIAKADSYKVLETALRMQGFSVVEGDGVIKVLPEADAKTYGMQTFTGSKVGKQTGDQVITKIFIIQRGSAMQLSNSLRPLIAPNNSISVYPNSNALIITDYASNINRISKIINQLSATSDNRVRPTIVHLKYAVAADVAQLLQSYLQNGGPSSGGGGGNSDSPTTSITVDSNANSLILYSTVQSQVEDLQALALKLDINTGVTNNNLHVVYLKNADAVHVADVLRVVATGQENADLTASSSLSKFASEPSSMFPSSGSGGGSSGGGGASAFGGGSSRPSSSSSSSMNRGGGGGQGNNAKDAPKIFIQADPTTNSLIIQAPDAVYRNLRMIVDMLDIRRAQIMIEAMLADVNTLAGGTFGIQWAVAGGNNQVGAIGIGNYGGGGSSIFNIAQTGMAISAATSGTSGATGAVGGTPPTLPNEMYIGVVGGTVSIGGQNVPTIGALADMVASNNAINIISRPTLITLDNEEAKIMVGSNVPVPNGSYQNTASNSTITNTYTRQSVGTFLDIKPLITQSGAIQLDLYVEDSQVDTSQGAASNPQGPTFLSRNVRTTLMVDNGQIIAIGGMTRDTVNIQKNGIPGLSSIPYLGWLFSWETRQHTKTNLVIFLRPVIIQNAEGYAALTNNRYRYILNQEHGIQAKGNLLLPEIDPVTLDNQMPYKDAVPPLQTNNAKLPIVDLRASSLKNSNTIKNGTQNNDTSDSNDTVILPKQ